MFTEPASLVIYRETFVSLIEVPPPPPPYNQEPTVVRARFFDKKDGFVIWSGYWQGFLTP